MLFRVVVLFRFELKSWGTNLQRLESQISKSSYITKIYTLKRCLFHGSTDLYMVEKKNNKLSKDNKYTVCYKKRTIEGLYINIYGTNL